MRKTSFVVSVALLVSIAVAQMQGQKPLDIYYIDTEHGKAVLYLSPSGQSMQVDTGSNVRDADRILAVMKEAGVQALDYLVISHYHGDHVGGAAAIASKIQIRQFIDHGPYTTQLQQNARVGFDSYLAVRQIAHATQAKPGEKIPIAGIDVRVVSSARQLMTTPLLGAGASNPLCRDFKPKADFRGVENDEVVGLVIQYGSFRVLDLADLLWNQEHDLVCPNNLLGTVDAYATTAHGQEYGSNPIMVHAVRPRVAIMNQGPNDTQGPTFHTLRSSPGFQDVWQSHYSQAAKEENSPEQFIANLEATPDHVGHYIKLSARPDGSFTVTNSRNGFTKEYPPKRTSSDPKQ